MSEKVSTIWNTTLSVMEEKLTKPGFQTWVRTLKPISYENNTIFIQASNYFVLDWIKNNYLDVMKDTLYNITGNEIEIKFSVVENDDKKDDSFDENISYKNSENEKEESFSSTLNPKYKFDAFVVGNSNRFAHAASLAVSQAPGRAYNPLFIYGGVGLGKTHLMHAIGQYVNENYSSLNVVYVSSERFTNEMINAIRDQKTHAFREKYRTMDVLLVDDIQFLAEKERTQEEFFHTFNALYESNKQIVISSDRPPKEIPTLEERLRSRFEWGLITDIHAPDLETRIAILRKKAESENLDIPNDVMVHIANQFHSNIRELEGALIRVVAFASLNNCNMSIELTNEILADILPSQNKKKISIPLIQKVVADYFNITINDMKTKKRTRIISHPRQIAMYLARELTELSLPKIGNSFGGRDHSTVIHAHDKIDKDMKTDTDLDSAIKEIINKLHSC